MQLTFKLSLDDSQVSSGWYPHQLMKRRLANLLSLSRSSSTANSQLQLMRASRQGSGTTRSLATDSRLPSQQQSSAAGALARTTGSGHKNALRLEGSDVWSPFSYTSLRRVSGAPIGAAHSGVVPIRAGPGLVLELAYVGALRWLAAYGPFCVVSSWGCFRGICLANSHHRLLMTAYHGTFGQLQHEHHCS